MRAQLRNSATRLLLLLGGCAVILAPFTAHAAIATGRITALAIAASAVQAAALAVVSFRQTAAWQRILGMAAATGLLVLLALKVVGSQAAGLAGLIASSGVSHAIIYVSLLILFARTLRPGRTALVTGLALRLRGGLTPAMQSYTRTVTKAWCAFFVLQLTASAVLLAFAPARAWSLFVNVLDAPLIAAMVLAEFAIRRWRFRHDQHSSPLAVARAFARLRAGG